MSRPFTIKDLEQLQASGKIRGFVARVQEKPVERKLSPEELALRKLGGKNKQWMFLMLREFAKGKDLILVTEFQFHQSRKFRSDFAIMNEKRTIKILIEYEGIVSFHGHHNGHTNINGYTKDSEKYNLAQAGGWTVLRYTAKNYKSLFDDLNKLINAGQ